MSQESLNRDKWLNLQRWYSELQREIVFYIRLVSPNNLNKITKYDPELRLFVFSRVEMFFFLKSIKFVRVLV